MAFDINQSSYEHFREIFAQRSDAVVAWVGAGLSSAAGVPTWHELKRQLCDELNKKANGTIEVEAQTKLRKRYHEANSSGCCWDAFSVLKAALGAESYRATIRKALKPAATAEVPAAYRHLWQLGIAGVLNLNLDRLVGRAFASVFNGRRTLHEFQASAAGERMYVLKGHQSFVANLHGIEDEHSSWVFTKQELRRLQANPGYRTLIDSCVTTRTILFVGISADDLAVGGHLERLLSKGIDAGPHFWLTHRMDLQTDQWAEKSGIRVIRYRNEDGTHGELQEFLADLKAYIPQDITAEPVVPPLSIVPLEPSPETLEKLSAEEIRQELNAKAVAILGSADASRIDEYERFCDLNMEAIHRAWFTTTTPPKNKILGYTLIQRIAHGAFGTVYRAQTDVGEPCAIKILHQQIHMNHERLQSFRRGVASMSILTQRGVSGIVPYRKAFEIPAFVVMDLIEGINLEEAVKKGVFHGNWELVLNVATRLAAIFRASHKLPERVMHRDIRPANIMLKDCWGPETQFEDMEVVVLDFDLSWHVNAYDVSITDASAVSGYLAPEQVNRDSHISTRNAAVDSFGLGMTLYFLRTGKEPMFSEHRHQNWEQSLSDAAANSPCMQWASLSSRFFRLISNSTRDRQQDRWDMATVEGELQQLTEAITTPTAIRSTELLAEELAARAFKNQYTWNEDNLSARFETRGTSVTICADETNARISVNFRWDQRNLKKYAARMRTLLESHLRKHGFTINTNILSGTAWLASVSIATSDLRAKLDDCVSGVQSALDSANSTC